MKVLLVDDEKEMVETQAERLSLRGIDADWVTRGMDAITHVNKRGYDVVVLDAKMPGMSGLETMKQIHGIRPGTKVIIITGHGSASECEAGIEAGACFYLMKPVNLEDLIEKMHEVTES